MFLGVIVDEKYKLERIYQDEKLIKSKVYSHIYVMQEDLLDSNKHAVLCAIHMVFFQIKHTHI